VKSLRKAYRGEKGFTLVELLVVVVILGVLAAVAVLAVTRFMGEGRLEAAQTELHQAQTAIAAAMSEAGAAAVPAGNFGPGSDLVVDNVSAQSFLHGPLTGTYVVLANGNIDDVTDEAVFGTGICWDDALKQWTDVGC
jgi:prepilin-type N-terminal cleavage/methylation domain-containing protein